MVCGLSKETVVDTSCLMNVELYRNHKETGVPVAPTAMFHCLDVERLGFRVCGFVHIGLKIRRVELRASR